MCEHEKTFIILIGLVKLHIKKIYTLTILHYNQFLWVMRAETIKGFSSQKQRKILKEERYAADEWLNSQNPEEPHCNN